MAYTAGFSVSVGDPTKASDVTTLAANDDFLKTAIDKIMVDSATPTFALVNGVTATTQSSGNNSTKLATTAYADAATISFANDANNRVVTGTGSGLNGEADLNFASNKLTVFGTTGTGAATASVLNLSTRETTVVDADQLGRIEFQAPAETGADAVLVAASIYAEADVTFDATNNATDLVLATAHDGAAAERFRITSQGEIGLAGANYGTDGQVMTSAGAGAAAAWETIPPGTTLSGSTAHTVATVTGANALEGEANLTFDGTTLAIGNTSAADYLALRLYQGGGTTYYWDFTADVDAGDLIIGGNNASFDLILNPSYGKVGIGTAVPDHIFHVQDVGVNSFNTKAVFDLENSRRAGYTQAALELAPASSGGAFRTRAIAAELIGDQSASDLVFYSESTEHMRITSGGEVLIGYSSGSWADSYGSTIYPGGTAIFHANGGVAVILRRATSYGDVMQFSHSIGGGTYVGSISVAASSTAYNTSSDYRLKENVVDLTGAATRVAQLQPHRFNFIRDPDTTVDGFVAHEVADIVPEAITGTKDEMRDVENAIVDADGAILEEGKTEAEWVAGKEPTLVSEATDEEEAVYADPIYAADTVWHSTLTVPEYQGIDQSKLVPLLTAAIQELTARVTALESA